ncbi:MAG: metalloregulator ArsR/SmtB family transcription factor [Patescibacteria group bacterium]|jgi:DNA-binding transcriptional ArsR family regulator
MDKKQLEIESRFFKGFADQSRLAILTELMEGAKTVSQIVEATGLSQPNTSTHLACLLECGLVQKEKIGREVSYELASKEIRDMIESARKIVREHADEIYKCTRY